MKNLLLIFFLLPYLLAPAQNILTVEQALDAAVKNHPSLLLAQKELSQQTALKNGAVNIAKTDVWLESPTAKHFSLGIQQNLSAPNVYSNQIKLQKEYTRLAEKNIEVSRSTLIRNIRMTYLTLQYLQSRYAQFIYQDSLYKQLYYASEKRYTAGEADYLEKLTAETRYFEVRSQLTQTIKLFQSAKEQLLLVTGMNADTLILSGLEKYQLKNTLPADTAAVKSNALLGYYSQSKMVQDRNLKLQRAFFYPGLMVGYLNQGNRNSEQLYRLRMGITLPLWAPYYIAHIKSAKLGVQVADLQYKSVAINLKNEYIGAYAEFEKSSAQISYFENFGLKQSDAIISTSGKLFNVGEVNYIIYLQSLFTALQIKMDYITAVRDYNNSIINLEYLQGGK